MFGQEISVIPGKTELESIKSIDTLLLITHAFAVSAAAEVIREKLNRGWGSGPACADGPAEANGVWIVLTAQVASAGFLKRPILPGRRLRRVVNPIWRLLPNASWLTRHADAVLVRCSPLSEDKVMPHIIVTPLALLHDVVEASRARHVLTLLEDRVTTPPGVTHHLAIDVHDIAEPVDGSMLCGEEHVALLVDFARQWDRSTPLVVHCWAGISRSTAAALTMAAALDPDRSEKDLAGELRDASPTATPNRRIIMLADDLLGRRGRLVDAVARIGRGLPATRGEPFRLTVPPTT